MKKRMFMMLVAVVIVVTLVPTIAMAESVTYTVTASASPTEGGTVSGDGTYPEATTVTLTAASNEGYKFINWTENGSEVSTEATITFAAAQNRDLTANFAAKSAVSISETAQNYVYNGIGRSFDITGTPTEDFTVQYMVNGSWTQDAPINAGTYDVKITRFEDADYLAYEKEIDDGLVIAPAVAKVGNSNYYATIKDAVDNWGVGAGNTLTLLDHVTLTDVIKLNSNEQHF